MIKKLDAQEILNKYKNNKALESYSKESIEIILNLSTRSEEISDFIGLLEDSYEVLPESYKLRCLNSVAAFTPKSLADFLVKSSPSIKSGRGSTSKDIYSPIDTYTLQIEMHNGDLFEEGHTCPSREILSRFEELVLQVCPDFYFKLLWNYYRNNPHLFTILSDKTKPDFILVIDPYMYGYLLD